MPPHAVRNSGMHTVKPKLRRKDHVAAANAVSASVRGAKTAGSNVGMTTRKQAQ
jgi:hypothetical protein